MCILFIGFSSKFIYLFICLDIFTGKQDKWENNGSANQQAESSIDVNAHKEDPSNNEIWFPPKDAFWQYESTKF